MRWVLAWIVVLAGCLPVQAETAQAYHADDVTLVEYGVFCVDPGVGRLPAPNTEAGYITLVETPPQLVKQGNRAPAILDLSFGVRWSIAGDLPQDVEIQIIRPRQDRASPLTESYTSVTLPYDLRSTLWTFDLASELATGLWVMEARSDARLLWRVSFDVVDAGEMPGIRTMCGDMLS